jgi:signal transduction histidine kinase
MYFSTDPSSRPVRSLPLYQTLLCVVCVLILVVNALSLLRNLDDLNAANGRQARADRVAAKLQYLNLLVTDAESGLRGYFLSGSDTYLGPLRTAERELDGQFGELARLVADDPDQSKNLSQLQALVRRRLALMREGLEVYRNGGLDDIVAIARAGEERNHMDEIRMQVVIMAGEQNERLAARGAAFYEHVRRAALLGIGINAAAIVVLVLFYNLIRRGFRLRLQAQQALQQTNTHLETLVATRTEQLSVLSHHLIRLSEEEKARLARELHDEMGANLTAIGIDLSTVGEQLKASRPELAASLARARATLVETVQLKRRIIEDLRPSLLDNLGLSAALQSYCEEFARVTGVDCEALIDDEVDQAGPMQAIALFRITQESLNNIAKYAKARHVVVHLAREGEALALEVSDDGVGIPADAMRRPKAHGLLGMRERALLLGGSLRVGRGVNGIGTSVHACVPLTAPGSDSAAALGNTSGDTSETISGTSVGTRSGALSLLALGQAAQGGESGQTIAIDGAHARLAAQAPHAGQGGGAAPIMHVQHPSADGHTHF